MVLWHSTILFLHYCNHLQTRVLFHNYHLTFVTEVHVFTVESLLESSSIYNINDIFCVKNDIVLVTFNKKMCRLYIGKFSYSRSTCITITYLTKGVTYYTMTYICITRGMFSKSCNVTPFTNLVKDKYSKSLFPSYKWSEILYKL